MTLFHEEQRFRSWWIWAIVVLADGPLVVTLLPSREFRLELLIVGVLVASLAVLLLAATLVVEVTRDEIAVTFQLLWPVRRIQISDVRRAQATTYNSLLEYGGYGVRFGWKGWAFNTGGSEGVLVETKSGKRIMLGSRRAKELEAAIAHAVADAGG